MRLGGWLHRRLAWLALCAMVFGAFAPSISKFLAATHVTPWVEICSTSGAKRIAIDLGSKTLPEAPMAGDNHWLLPATAPYPGSSDSSLHVGGRHGIDWPTADRQRRHHGFQALRPKRAPHSGTARLLLTLV